MIDHYIEDTTSNLNAVMSGDYDRFIAFVFDCFLLAKNILPDEVNTNIHLAKQYWNERILSKEALKEARIQSWKFLDKKRKCNSKEYQAVKASLILLYDETWSDSMGENMQSFLEDFFF